jgi:acetyltransferase-like isoleucine patch superfamily enzyme
MDQIQIYKEKVLETYSTKVYKNAEKKFVKNLALNISTFGITYFLANLIPVLCIFYYFYEYFFPFYLQNLTIIHIFMDIRSLLIFLITPFILILLFLINLFMVILISKILYKVFQFKIPSKEGIFHWNDKNPDFKSYFKRSFILRHTKWKIQKSPFPWLIKPAFRFIGNCQFGKNTVIEDCFIAKEFLKIGSNSYLGKALLAHHLWDKNLTIKRIIIGDNVEISDNCCIAPGTVIENNVSVLPLSVTSKNGKLSSNSIYYHSPSKKIADLDSRYSFIHKLGDNHV